MGQYTEKRSGNIYKGINEAGAVLKEMMRLEKKYLITIHYLFHWSFTVIDNKKKKRI